MLLCFLSISFLYLDPSFFSRTLENISLISTTLSNIHGHSSSKELTILWRQSNDVWSDTPASFAHLHIEYSNTKLHMYFNNNSGFFRLHINLPEVSLKYLLHDLQTYFWIPFCLPLPLIIPNKALYCRLFLRQINGLDHTTWYHHHLCQFRYYWLSGYFWEILEIFAKCTWYYF